MSARNSWVLSYAGPFNFFGYRFQVFDKGMRTEERREEGGEEGEPPPQRGIILKSGNTS